MIMTDNYVKKMLSQNFLFFNEQTIQCEPYTIKGQEKKPQYIVRIDPLSGNISRISKERADEIREKNIGITTDLDIKPVENCVFCNYEKTTPEKRIIHNNGAVTFRNIGPWEKIQWVTAYPPFEPYNSGHKLLLSELLYDDLDRMIETEHELASLCHSMYKNDGDIVGFRDFTNWGPFAGGSQQHPHSQRGTITKYMGPAIEKEISFCKYISDIYGKNAFDVLIYEENKQGRRVIYSNDVYIGAAFAPKCNDEIIIVPKESISNVLQMDTENWKRMIHPILGVFAGLFFYRGVRDLNISVHMAPFDKMEEMKDYYRWHMHVYPRKSSLPVHIAGAELGDEEYVIGTLPENTAYMLKQWFKFGGPDESIVPQNLKEEFKKHLEKTRK